MTIHTTQSPEGVLIDIDDTIVDTSVACATEIWKRFPLEDFDSPLDVLSTYGMPERVSSWDRPEVHVILHRLLGSVEFLESLPEIPLARDGLYAVAKNHPVSGYLTSRLPFALEATTRWLEFHSFPKAPVIYRFPDTTDRDWKVKYMEKNLPNSLGIVDNELYLPEEISYKGKLIELIRFRLLSQFDERKTICHNWQEVVGALIASLY